MFVFFIIAYNPYIPYKKTLIHLIAMGIQHIWVSCFRAFAPAIVRLATCTLYTSVWFSCRSALFEYTCRIMHAVRCVMFNAFVWLAPFPNHSHCYLRFHNVQSKGGFTSSNLMPIWLEQPVHFCFRVTSGYLYKPNLKLEARRSSKRVCIWLPFPLSILETGRRCTVFVCVMLNKVSLSFIDSEIVLKEWTCGRCSFFVSVYLRTVLQDVICFGTQHIPHFTVYQPYYRMQVQIKCTRSIAVNKFETNMRTCVTLDAWFTNAPPDRP